ncbi:hypothetical protein LguiB_012580 [Lonicera macranthoides]
MKLLATVKLPTNRTTRMQDITVAKAYSFKHRFSSKTCSRIVRELGKEAP